MGAHVGHLDTEVAAALVDIQLTGLEDAARALLAAVEVREYNIIAQQLREIAVVQHQAAHLVDGVRLVLEGLVGVDQCEQVGLAVGLQQGLDFVLGSVLVKGVEFESVYLSPETGRAEEPACCAEFFDHVGRDVFEDRECAFRQNG